MFTFKDDVVNKLTDSERFDLISNGMLREPIYDFGTELVINDDNESIKYECEYLTEECSLLNARMLWCVKLRRNEFLQLPADPLYDSHYDDEYDDESYKKLKKDISVGNYPTDLSKLTPKEMHLILPKLMESGIISFDREKGEYTLSKFVKEALDSEVEESAE